MGVRITIELEENLLAKLDALAMPIAKQDVKISQYMWLTATDAGKQVRQSVVFNPAWQKKPIEEMNTYLKEQYHKAVGAAKMGRPALSRARGEVIEALLNKGEAV